MPDCDLLAFGVSGIGQIEASYYQNHRDLAGYYEAIDHGVLPIKRGIALSADDVLRRAVIQALLCQFASTSSRSKQITPSSSTAISGTS